LDFFSVLILTTVGLSFLANSTKSGGEYLA